MPKTIWMEGPAKLDWDGPVASFTFQGDGEAFVVRCKRHVALASIKGCGQRWCELELAEREAAVLPIGKR